MRRGQGAAGAALAAIALLGGCGTTQLTPQQRDDQFWDYYQKQVAAAEEPAPDPSTPGTSPGPALSKDASVALGRQICAKLAGGESAGDAISQGSGGAGLTDVELSTVGDAAQRFLCPPGAN